MPRGAAVIRYDGKRRTVWRIKYRDAAGKQVQETLGLAPQWNERRAERELGKRLAAVEEEGYRKPERLTFAAFAEKFMSEYLPGRNLKRTTLENYHYMLDGHLVPFFGPLDLGEIEAKPELVDRYLALKAREGLSPKTIHNHVLLLNVMLKRALIWRLIRANPVETVGRPRLQHPEMNVFSEVEIERLATAYDELAAEADHPERAWWELAKAIVFIALGTALRRGELLALRWRHVNLLEARIEVREAFVRGEWTTPKSKASRRTIDVGPVTLAVLEARWRATQFRGDDELVFCHPEKGTPVDPSRLARVYLKQAIRRAGIERAFRPFHDLRHTSLTHTAAAGNPQIYVQARAGHSQGSITERYMHAAQVSFPGAAERTEDRMFSHGAEKLPANRQRS